MGDISGYFSEWMKDFRRGLFRPEMLAFVPALLLGGVWFGLRGMALITILVIPVLLIVGRQRRDIHDAVYRDAETGLPLRSTLLEQISTNIERAAIEGLRHGCMIVEIDDHDDLVARMGRDVAERTLRTTAERVQSALRDGDMVARLDGACLAIAMMPKSRINLEALLQIVERVQDAVSEPVGIDSATVYITVSIGFCISTRAPADGPEALLSAAETAAEEARRNGPAGVRAYSQDMQSKIAQRNALVDDVLTAFDEGQIRPWFQPQISCDTGEITGFEALARWDHPERGMIPTSEFLPAVDSAGLMTQMGEVILYQCLNALRSWDRAGLNVPCVGINFSMHELQDPKLISRMRWELDRFELTADRVTVEVLETVVAQTDEDTISRNIAGLAAMGCQIDLDDFGTGHASFTNIRRFGVDRIKIDRSIVMSVDTDREQQKMVNAILMMAEQLELDTLAEGVETVAEHAILAQMGCGHVQGFGLARPMPFDDTIPWIERHLAKLEKTPQIGRRSA